MGVPVQALVAALFATVGVMLGYGLIRFRQVEVPANRAGRQVSMRLEVVWTAMSAALLFALFVWAR